MSISGIMSGPISFGSELVLESRKGLLRRRLWRRMQFIGVLSLLISSVFCGIGELFSQQWMIILGYVCFGCSSGIIDGSINEHMKSWVPDWLTVTFRQVLPSANWLMIYLCRCFAMIFGRPMALISAVCMSITTAAIPSVFLKLKSPHYIDEPARNEERQALIPIFRRNNMNHGYLRLRYLRLVVLCVVCVGCGTFYLLHSNPCDYLKRIGSRYKHGNLEPLLKIVVSISGSLVPKFSKYLSSCGSGTFSNGNRNMLLVLFSLQAFGTGFLYLSTSDALIPSLILRIAAEAQPGTVQDILKMEFPSDEYNLVFYIYPSVALLIGSVMSTTISTHSEAMQIPFHSVSFTFILSCVIGSISLVFCGRFSRRSNI